MTVSPRKHLENRLIHNEADKALWLENDVKHRWQYPVFDRYGKVIATRSKAYPEYADEMKYGWVPNKPANPDAQWYVLPGTEQEIKLRDGVAYLSNGEPALLAYHAGGIPNVIATTLSEIAVPTEAVSYLRAIGVSRLLYPMDKDEAGLKSAINWRDALAGSGIDFEAFEWPEIMPAKADANDVLIHAHGDSQAFRLVINSLQAIELPAQEVDEKKYTLPAEFNKPGLVSAVRQALEQGNHFGRKIRQRVWLECHCPFHTDKKISAGFNIESGVINCFGSCGKAFSPIAVAEHFNIDWKQFLPEHVSQNKPNSRRRTAPKLESSPSLHEIEAAPEIEELYDFPAFPGGLTYSWIKQAEIPLSWVKSILHLSHGKSLVPIFVILLHRAIRQGRINPRQFTITQLMNVLGFPRKSIQNAIDTLLAWNFFRILLTTLFNEGLETESGKNSSAKVGRPETYYCLNMDTDGLRLELAERMQAYLLERLTPEWELAPRLPSLRESMDLDLEVFRTWRERTRSPQHETIENTIENWTMDILCNDLAYVFAAEDLESPFALRGKLLQTILKPYEKDVIALDKDNNPVLDEKGKPVILRPKGLQISRADLSLALGTSESSLSKLYAENDIASKRMYGWVKVEGANGCDIEKELWGAPAKLNSAIGGAPIAIYMRVWDYGIEKKLPLIYLRDKKTDYKKIFEKWNGKIISLEIWVEQHSLLWLMSEDEKAAKSATKQAEIKATEGEMEYPAQEAEKAPKQATDKPKKERTKSAFIGGRDRTWRGHTPEFEREELTKEVARFTAYHLQGLALLDEAEEVVVSVKSLQELVVWLNENTAKKAKVAEAEKASPITDSRSFTPKTEGQKGTYSQAAQAEDEWSWAEHQEEFAARMRAIGG